MRRVSEQRTRPAGNPWVTELMGQGGVGLLSQMRPSGGGGDGVSTVEALTTTENDTALRLAPDGAGGVEWSTGGGSGAAEDLTTTEMNGAKVLTPDGAGGVQWSNDPFRYLDDLLDVNTAGKANADVLAWNSGAGEWQPTTPSAPGAHESTHEAGEADELPIENMGTAETSTTKVLKPDGAGGVAWGTGGAGGGTVHQHATFSLIDPPAGTTTYPLFEASASITVTKVRTIQIGTGSCTVNAVKNARGSPSDILASELTPSTTWGNADPSSPVSLSAGDEIDVRLTSVAGYVGLIVVQVDYEEEL